MTPALTDAVLVVDKPAGMTSFDVVRQVRRAARARHVGHGGTLDPLATGVLPICLGEATKLAQFLLDAEKEYDVVIRLGAETDTDDAAGVVTAQHDVVARLPAIDRAVLDAVLGRFRGAQEQVPPAYAALKRAGRPLYDYARAGEEVVIAPRPVVIHELVLTTFDAPDTFGLHVRCSKGTYVRALARDIGRALGVGGHVAALRRTRSGPFPLAVARPLEEVTAALAGGGPAVAALQAVSLGDALAHLERRTVSDDLAADLRAGRRVEWRAVAGPEDLSRLCVLDRRGALVAVVERSEKTGDGPERPPLLQSLRVFGVGH